MGQHEKSKPKKNKYRKKRSSTEKPQNIFDKIIKNFHNIKKDMAMKI